jgi:hypothetical protein
MVHDDIKGSVLTSLVTAFVATLPTVVNYAEKVVSVLVLAMVAEIGRRFIASLGKKKS